MTVLLHVMYFTHYIYVYIYLFVFTLYIRLIVLTPRQKDIYEKIKELVELKSDEPLHFPSDYPARDRVFIQNLADELNIEYSIEEGEDRHVYVQYDSEEESDEDIIETREKVFRKYTKAEVIEEEDAETFERRKKQEYETKFIEWKGDYYKTKMNIDYDNKEEMYKLIGSYVEGLQWVLHYYYNGVASWGWFYPYHYSPKISGERFIGININIVLRSKELSNLW